jgi:hypothetical protein
MPTVPDNDDPEAVRQARALHEQEWREMWRYLLTPGAWKYDGPTPLPPDDDDSPPDAEDES